MKKIVVLAVLLLFCMPLFSTADSISLVFNYPNPFSPSKGETTKIAFNYVNNSGSTINDLVYYVYIYDVAGKKVMVKKGDTVSSVATGTVRIEFVWNGNNDKGKQVAPGIYFIKIVTDGYTGSKQSISKIGKMMVK